MTASRSSDVRIGLPTGIWTSLADAAFDVEGALGGQSRALPTFAVGFQSFGGLRALGIFVASGKLSDVADVLTDSCSWSGWLDVWAISVVRVSVA